MSETNQATIYTDGGSRGNPGPAAYAYVIKRPGEADVEEYQQKEARQARAGDPAVRNKEGVILLEDEIYYVTRKSHTVEEMERFFRQPRYAIGLVGIFCSAGPRELQKISKPELFRFVEAMEKIMVGAFDGEGFLLWTASELPQVTDGTRGSRKLSKVGSEQK